jgi:integrase
MGRAETGGIEIRETSIRIVFSYQGKQRKETIYLDNAPLSPTPPNVKYAKRIASEIKDKIRSGDFVYADYFPHSPAAKEGGADDNLMHNVMDRWIKLAVLQPSTRKQYKGRIEHFWKPRLKNGPIDRVRHSDILEALQSGTWKSVKSRNNELSLINQVFEFAAKDRLIRANPCADIDRPKGQKKKPDPFTLEEAEQIIAALSTRYGEEVSTFYEIQFFGGFRTNEGIGLKWDNVDFKRREILVEGGIVYDDETDSTKTAVSRTVKLNSRTLAAVQRQKAKTRLRSEYLFADPEGNPWAYQKMTDARMYWKPTLKKLGIRYRRPYNTRHTYATVGLMAGVNPAFLAKQLGHSLKMFFEVYADWINGDQDDREMAKLEAALVPVNPELSQKEVK